MTKVAKKLPTNPTLNEQVELLKREVLILHDLFERGTAGKIVSILQRGMYWVLLNNAYKTKDGKWSRRRPFHPEELRLIDEKD